MTMPVADFALTLQEQEAVQSQHRADPIFPHPLGLGLGPGPYPAVDVESAMPPGKNPLGPFRAQELLADNKPEDLKMGREGPKQ
jgi:hypothetical protein